MKFKRRKFWLSVPIATATILPLATISCDLSFTSSNEKDTQFTKTQRITDVVALVENSKKPLEEKVKELFAVYENTFEVLKDTDVTESKNLANDLKEIGLIDYEQALVKYEKDIEPTVNKVLDTVNSVVNDKTTPETQEIKEIVEKFKNLNTSDTTQISELVNELVDNEQIKETIDMFKESFGLLAEIPQNNTNNFAIIDPDTDGKLKTEQAQALINAFNSSQNNDGKFKFVFDFETQKMSVEDVVKKTKTEIFYVNTSKLSNPNNTQSDAYYVADLITPITKENTLNTQITKIYLNQTTGTFSFGFKVYKKVNNTNVEVDNRKHMFSSAIVPLRLLIKK
ncbi:hypothetical protein [Mycoplasmopsis columbinasalis]|uniref:Lipoprotein n=1 Tax=Mycoplasmopsis columbinasalis TaxID=114880 RepID=A0A449BA98_9BACT|nr:hypothetical protein [Mycoplasmopsis columbinasalis]VEU78098.1 Uncharacterised protein [Mycoplasmopsis columbinasalis]